jgi:(p)ppGpp synthase/HD superfamily hydrolase
MTKDYQQIEKAIRALTKYFVDGTDYGKPVLAHSIRAGTYLYEKGYSIEIVVAGYLHDTLEDTEITEELIKTDFSEEVLNIVKANTKDASLTDRSQRHRELLQRCAKAGKTALIVKCADILDNYKYYTAVNNTGEVSNCIDNAKILKELTTDDYGDPLIREVLALGM